MSGNIYQGYENTELYLDLFLESPKKVQQLLMMPLAMEAFYPDFWNDESIKSPIDYTYIYSFEIYCKYNNKENIYLFSQKEVICNKKRYYIDFEFEADDYLSHLILGEKIKNSNFKLAIECDGYEFHQKTKEQVQKDNEREYDLKMAGYEVYTYIYSQIYNNPLKCAEDTYNYIMKKIEEV